MSIVLIPIPSTDFDPTETAVPWKALRARGHSVLFATPDGQPGSADDRMLTGRGLDPLASMLMADANGLQAYGEMQASPEFGRPLRYQDVRLDEVHGVLLPGGHAPGMKPYLESQVLQRLIADAFEQNKPVGAICHGVVLAARSRMRDGRSVLHGRRTTALTAQLELTGWALTCVRLGRYYRTYPTTVQAEVIATLTCADDFDKGPISVTRDSPTNLAVGFTVRDGSYLSARWPGDSHKFGSEFTAML